jgi:hypothetical protein
MLTNELLEAKYCAQRALAVQGGDDLHEYAQNVHQVVRDVERKHGLKFRYGYVGKQTASAHDLQTSSSSDRIAA